MKRIYLTSVIFLWAITNLAAQYNFLTNAENVFTDYYIKPNYEKSVKMSQLKDAVKLSDFIENYPTSWISKYNSIELKINNNIYKGKSEILTSAQLNALKSVIIGDELLLDVVYENLNNITKKPENGHIKLTMSVIPEKEAYFNKEKNNIEIKEYIKTNCIEKIDSKILKEIKDAEVLFTIDENGNASNVKIKKSSGNTSSDEIIFKFVGSIKKWAPAIDNNKNAVKQEFLFCIKQSGC